MSDLTAFIIYILKHEYSIVIAIIVYSVSLYLLFKKIGTADKRLKEPSILSLYGFIPAIFFINIIFYLMLLGGTGAGGYENEITSTIGIAIMFFIPPCLSLLATVYQNSEDLHFNKAKKIIIPIGIAIALIPNLYIVRGDYHDIQSGAINPIPEAQAIVAAEKELNPRVKHDSPRVDFGRRLTKDAAAYSIEYELYRKSGTITIYTVNINAKTGQPIYLHDAKKVTAINQSNGSPISDAEIYAFRSEDVETSNISDYGITNDDGSARLLIYPKDKMKFFLYDEKVRAFKYYVVEKEQDTYVIDWDNALVAPYTNFWAAEYPNWLNTANETMVTDQNEIK